MSMTTRDTGDEERTREKIGRDRSTGISLWTQGAASAASGIGRWAAISVLHYDHPCKNITAHATG